LINCRRELKEPIRESVELTGSEHAMTGRRVESSNRDDAFALVELLVVIIIIGILAAIAVPVYLHQRAKAIEATMRSDLLTVAQQMEVSYVDARTYSRFSAKTAPKVGGVKVPLSAGNSVASIKQGAAAGTFCLRVTNSSISTKSYYDSDRGGLRGTSPCT